MLLEYTKEKKYILDLFLGHFVHREKFKDRNKHVIEIFFLNKALSEGKKQKQKRFGIY